MYPSQDKKACLQKKLDTEVALLKYPAAHLLFIISTEGDFAILKHSGLLKTFILSQYKNPPHP
jgi:hypothetical protein